MLDRIMATRAARAYLKGLEGPGTGDLILQESATIERELCWIFFYNTKRFLETGEYGSMAIGNGPLIVDRRDGSVHVAGTARPVEHYVDRFERTVREAKGPSEPR